LSEYILYSWLCFVYGIFDQEENQKPEQKMHHMKNQHQHHQQYEQQKVQRDDAASTFSVVTKTVIVDSRDRDMGLFPNPAQYDIPLDEEIQDVASLELIGAEIPMISYLITKRNCTLPFMTSAGPERVAALRLGDYSADELAQEVQSAMATALKDSQAVRVRYVPRLDNYEIRAKTQLTLKFAASMGSKTATTCHRLLGFGMKDYASTADALGDPLFPEVILSEYRKDFETDRYAVLHIDPAYVNHNAINDTVNKSFAIIPRSARTMNLCAEEQRTKTFRPPIPRFTKLRIKLLDFTGDLYDLHNRDHRLELRFSCIRQKKYTQQQFAFPFEGIVSEM
jgi:hypothetical protein